MCNAFKFLALFLLLTSCQKPDDICIGCPTGPDTTKTNAVKVLWQIPLNPDTTDCVSMKPVVHNGNVLYSMLFYIDGYEFLRMVNAQTGAPVWNWDPIWPGETTHRMSRFVKDNVMIMTHWGPTYCIDLYTGQNVWANTVDSENTTGKPQLGRVGDFVYTEHSDKQIIDTMSYFVRANISDGKWDTLFSMKSQNKYTPSVHPPGLWLSPEGDSILIFQNRQWNFPASDGKIDLWAYNLNTRTFVWKLDDIDALGNSSVEHPFIYDNKVYFLGQKILYCFDAATGTQLWSWKTPVLNDNLMQSNLLVAEGKIFIKPTNEHSLYGLDPSTGRIKTFISNAGSGPVVMSYHDGIIYYASGGNGRLYALRLSTQEVIWDIESPNDDIRGKWMGNTIFDDLTISPELGCLFVSDRYFLMAIELPK